MSTETRFTPSPWSREDATVYTLAKDGGNRFQAQFTRGFGDDGKRIDLTANAELSRGPSGTSA